MNSVHNVLCSSGWWARRAEFELIPFGLKGVDAGRRRARDRTRVRRHHAGPGRALRQGQRARAGRALLPAAAGRRSATRSRSPRATRRGFRIRTARFSSVLCFTMLHHIPSLDLQDRAFSEIARVLRPGGTFAGTDSLGNGLVFKLIHVGDTLNLIDPETLPRRLEAAGMVRARGQGRGAVVSLAGDEGRLAGRFSLRPRGCARAAYKRRAPGGRAGADRRRAGHRGSCKS